MEGNMGQFAVEGTVAHGRTGGGGGVLVCDSVAVWDGTGLRAAVYDAVHRVAGDIVGQAG